MGTTQSKPAVPTPATTQPATNLPPTTLASSDSDLQSRSSAEAMHICSDESHSTSSDTPTAPTSATAEESSPQDLLQTEPPPPSVPDRDSSAHFLNIPLELFELIAEDVNKQDIRALRLTSKEAAAKLQRMFVNANFKERSMLISSERSLQNAIEIAKHEVLGPALEKVTVLLNEIASPDQQGFFKTCSNPYRESNATTRAAEHLIAYQAQKSLRTNNDDLYLLTELFNIIKGQGNPIEIAIGGQIYAAELGKSHFHEAHVHLEDTVALYNIPRDDSNRPYITVMQALVLSGLHAEEVTWQNDRAYNDDETCDRMLDVSNLKNGQPVSLEQALRNSEYFHIKTFFNCAKGWEVATERANEFCQMPARLPSLKGLRIELENEDEDRYVDPEILFEALCHCRFPSLESLEIDGMDMDILELAEFVHAQPKLKELTVCPQMMGLEDEIWVFHDYDSDPTRIVDALKRCIKLEQVWLGGLREHIDCTRGEGVEQLPVGMER